MQDIILENILELTRQPDTESLHRAFMQSIWKLVHPDVIKIYRMSCKANCEILERIFLLESQADSDKGYTLNEHICGVSPSESAIVCQSVEDFSIQQQDETVLIQFFVSLSGEYRFVFLIQGNDFLLESQKIVQELLTFYREFIVVLDRGERDKLTGLYNRSTFDAKLNRMLSQQKEMKLNSVKPSRLKDEHRYLDSNASAWLAILDIDKFKLVNDRYGHVAGDEVLLLLSQKMKQYFRRTDLLFRFGGEEFVLVLEPVSREMAQVTLERFRNQIANHQFPMIGRVTVSIGYASISEHDFPMTILERADKALYAAKEAGRNRVANYCDLVDQGVISEAQVSGSVDLF